LRRAYTTVLRQDGYRGLWRGTTPTLARYVVAGVLFVIGMAYSSNQERARGGAVLCILVPTTSRDVDFSILCSSFDSYQRCRQTSGFCTPQADKRGEPPQWRVQSRGCGIHT
jgi:hypothetical protein